MQSQAQSLTWYQLIKKSTGATVIAMVLAGFLTMLLTTSVNAATPESKPKLDCLSCHPKTLQFHDKLGSENKACWVCHDGTDMKTLRLVDEAPLSFSNSPQLCGQCHQKRYTSWKDGTHGISGTVATASCTTCHDPHQPQIALLDITKPHPALTPLPPSPPFKAWAMLGILLLLLPVIAFVVIGSRRGEEP